jgi:hypothetical protein
VKSEAVLLRLVKRYGVRRAVTLFGAASIAAQRGWDALVGDDAYSRQIVWLWKRDLDAAGIDPASVEWSGLERQIGADVGLGLQRGKEKIRRKNAAAEARAAHGRAAT